MREERAADLGYPVSSPPAPRGLYVPAVRVGDLVFTSGTVPIRDGELAIHGHVGAEVSLEEAQEGARLCLQGALAALREVVGELENVLRVVRLGGFVSSAHGFGAQPRVMDAASQMLIDIFGDAGRCARTAVGVAELPLGAPVELDLVVQLRS